MSPKQKKSSAPAPKPEPKKEEAKSDEPKKRERKPKNFGNIIASKGPREIGEFVVKEWQRLPKTLLSEYCQKQKRPPPQYPTAKCEEKSKFRVRCVLPDPKLKEKDLSVCPTQSYASQQLATEYAALLALWTIDSTRQWETKFPEPFAGSWKSMRTDTPDVTATSKFVSNHERTTTVVAAEQAKAQKQNKIAIKEDLKTVEYVSVFMSDTVRIDIETLLRQLTARELKQQASTAADNSLSPPGDLITRTPSPALPLSPAAGTGSDAKSPAAAGSVASDESEQLRAALTEKLVKSGFLEKDAQLGVTQAIIQHANAGGATLAGAALMTALQNRALDWCCLNIPEHRLPDQYNPQKKGLVIVSNQKTNLLFTLLGAGRMGFPSAVCDKALATAKDDAHVALAILFDELYADAIKADTSSPAVAIDAASAASAKSHREEELIALESIFDADFKVLTETSWSVQLTPDPLPSSLELHFPGAETGSACSRYPLNLPILIYRCTKISAHQRLHVVQSLVRWAIAQQMRGAAMLYLLVDRLKSSIEDILSESPAPRPKAWPRSEAEISEKLDAHDARDRSRKEQSTAAAAAADSDSSARGSGRGRGRGGRGGRGGSRNDTAAAPAPGGAVAAAAAYKAAAAAAAAASAAGDATTLSASGVPITELSSVGSAGTDSKDVKSSAAPTVTAPQPQRVRAAPAANPQLSASLKEQFARLKTTDDYKAMLNKRVSLPAYKERARVVDLVSKHQVVVISGATGCGKSTQIPQFILDAALESGTTGATTNIICTQPRRISAVGLADRVADERAQECGDVVGYRIRMEAKVSAATRLCYVTTGILLRQLTGRNALADVSHIIIDEVHERSVEIDFLLLILRQILPLHPHLKLVLMSATLDAEIFCAYFSRPKQPPVPVISIPGRTFPVKEYYLGDIIEQTGWVPRSGRKPKDTTASASATDTKEALTDGNKFSPSNPAAQSATAAAGDAGDAKSGKPYIVDEAKLNLDLAEHVVLHLLSGADDGAILVFLPGLAEISKLNDKLKRSANPETTLIVPLHGALNTSNQRKVFSRPPRGMRKVVLSTNIAETSVTIDDIVYVVDSGRMKETEYDNDKKMSMLVETWVSKANATQRKGRAGRVREGVCYRLFTDRKFSQLPAHQLPEIHRVPLDHVILQIKLLKLDAQLSGGGAAAVIRQAIQPPEENSITSAISFLKSVKALDADTESLTPLGQHLARLPVSNVMIGKLLLTGATLSCVTPIISIAALLSVQSPFVAPLEKRDAANEARMKFAVAKSDHLTLLKAYDSWLVASEGGSAKERAFCSDNFLSSSTLNTVKGMTAQYADALMEIGFLPRGGTNKRRAGVKALPPSVNENSANQKILLAVLCAGLYPNVIRVRHPEETYHKTMHGSVPIANDPKDIRFFINHADGRVFLHPRTVNFSAVQYESPWLVYNQLMATGKVYVHDSSMVYPYALLLFGDELTVDHEKGLISVGKQNWIRFKCSGRIPVLLKELRRFFDLLLTQKVHDPDLELSAKRHPVIQAILQLLSSNGF